MGQPFSEADEELIAELLLNWQDSQLSDKPASPRHICGHRIDLVPELIRRIELLTQIDGLILESTRSSAEMGQSQLDGDDSTLPEISSFRIISELGRGGMSVVYRAIQERLNREVAIKIIRGNRWSSKRMIRRFRNEAAILARLNCPSVVQIFDVVESAGSICLILEFVEGTTLKQWLNREALAPDKAANLAIEISRTVDTVHSAGILHRDLKPSNFLIDRHGRLKITDFGIAKQISNDSEYTITGDIIGSPSYMAPEQAMGQNELISERTDVYAIGATLYEMLAGEPPFIANSMLETLNLVSTADPKSIRSLHPQVPIDLETICLKCLEKKPSERYATAGELADELERFLNHRPILARSIGIRERGVRWCRRHPKSAILGIAGLIVVIVFSFGLAMIKSQFDAVHRQIFTQAERLRETEIRNQIAEIRARRTQSEGGWLPKNKQAIAALAVTKLSDEVRVELRSEFLRCLCSCDLSEVQTVFSDVNYSRMSLHPYQNIVALAENHSTNGASFQVRIVDTNGFETVRSLTVDSNCPQIPAPGGGVAYAINHIAAPNKVLDGCRALEFSPTGDRLLLGSRRGRIYIWETSTWTLTNVWDADNDWIVGLCFTEDNRSLYSLAKTGTIKLWDLFRYEVMKQGQIAGEAYGMLSRAGGIVIAADIPMVADRNKLVGYDMIPNWHGAATRIIATRGDNGVLSAMGDRLSQVEVYQGAANQEIREFVDPRLRKAHQNNLMGIGISNSGRFAASSDINSIRLWDWISGELLATRNLEEEAANSILFLRGESQLLVSGRGKLTLYEVVHHPAFWADPFNSERLFSASLSHDGSRLVQVAAEMRDTKIAKSTIRSQRLCDGSVAQASLSKANVSEVILLRDGSTILGIDHTNNTIRLFNAESCEEVKSIRAAGLPSLFTESREQNKVWYVADDLEATGLRSAPSALFLCDLDSATTRKMWSNIETMKLIARSQILAIGLGNDVLTTSSRGETIRVHRAETGEVTARIKVPTDVTALRMLNDSKVIAGDQRGGIRILGLPDGSALSERTDHRDEISGLELHPDGRLLVSACRGGELRFWRLDDQQLELKLTATIGPFSGPIIRIKLSDDCNTLMVVVDREAAARVIRLDEFRADLRSIGLDWNHF